MSPEQKVLVQKTWRRIVPIANTASAMFYDRLFEIDPDLRRLFDGVDLASQRKKLVEALAAVVDALDDTASIAPGIAALGRRHATYGVTAAHYDTVGAALLWTLEQGLGDLWTAEVRAAWTAAYGLVAGVMQGAAADDRRSHPVAPLAAIPAPGA